MPDEAVLSGSQLRRRYRVELRALHRHPPARAAFLFAASLLTVFIAPALAEGPHTFHLQGTGIATEFVNQPYAMASGTLDGRHVNLQSGLLGFTDGRGLTGTGYCVDARTHRRHDADYTDGPPIDAGTVRNAPAVLWLLRHGYPNGPALLGGGESGLARSSSVVQAAIWHFSDGFELDSAGSTFVDPAYRTAYDNLLREAAVAAPLGHALLTLQGPPGNTVAADAARSRFDVSVRVFADDGFPAPDGTEVQVSSNAAGLATPRGALLPHHAGNPLTVRTTGGRGVVVVAFDPAAAGDLSLTARANLATPPGRLLVSSVPTQRLVETSWGRETVEATIHVMVMARPRPTPSVAPRPTPRPRLVKPPQAPIPPPALPTAAAPEVTQPTPAPELPPTPALPSTGHDARWSISLSALLAVAGVVVLWRSRRVDSGP